MSYDEKTTEIEIPTKREGNVVRVDFAAMEAKNRAAQSASNRAPSIQTSSAVVARLTPKPRQKPWWSDIEVSTPWLLRLLAVVSVLILSLLIF